MRVGSIAITVLEFQLNAILKSIADVFLEVIERDPGDTT